MSITLSQPKIVANKPMCSHRLVAQVESNKEYNLRLKFIHKKAKETSPQLKIS